MGVFQVIFVAINLYVPYWVWSNSSREKSKVEWTTLEKNVARLIESDEGFPPCETLQVVDIFHELCETSMGKLKDTQSTRVERASKQVVFHCEFRKNEINIGWRLESSNDAKLECGEPGGDVIAFTPSFNFTHTGRMKSIAFIGQGSQVQAIPYRNCRAKASRLATLRPSPRDLDDFLSSVGKTEGDPPDYLRANLLCLTFDSSKLWKPWRQRYLQ
jgi:hypothetical protein